MSTKIGIIDLRKSNIDTARSRGNRLYPLSGAAAISAGILFLAGVINLIIAWFRFGAISDRSSLISDNWLVVIFKVHAGSGAVPIDRLHGLNILDSVILALVGTIMLGLYPALRQTSKIWSIIALAQPFLGIVLFIATQTAGRSGAMGAILVISAVMLRNHTFSKVAASMGILLSVFLLIGDFSAGILHSNMITALFGAGYLLLIAWLFLIAGKFYQLGQKTKGSVK